MDGDAPPELAAAYARTRELSERVHRAPPTADAVAIVLSTMTGAAFDPRRVRAWCEGAGMELR